MFLLSTVDNRGVFVTGHNHILSPGILEDSAASPRISSRRDSSPHVGQEEMKYVSFVKANDEMKPEERVC
jgi:hypothetical protein